MIRIVDEDAPGAQRMDVAVVTMLIKSDKEVRIVTGREDVAGPHSHLKDGRTPGNGRRNRHVGHHLLVGSAGEAGEESAYRLDAILGVACQAYDDIANRARL